MIACTCVLIHVMLNSVCNHWCRPVMIVQQQVVNIVVVCVATNLFCPMHTCTLPLQCVSALMSNSQAAASCTYVGPHTKCLACSTCKLAACTTCKLCACRIPDQLSLTAHACSGASGAADTVAACVCTHHHDSTACSPLCRAADRRSSNSTAFDV